MPEHATETGLALLIILILVKDIIVPLFRGKGPDPIAGLDKTNQALDKLLISMGVISDTLTSNKNRISDIHEWLKPDHTGQQTWKSHPSCNENKTSIGRLFSFVNDRFVEIKSLIEGKQ